MNIETGHIRIERGLSTAVVQPKCIATSVQNRFNTFLVDRLEGIPFLGVDKPNEAVAIQSNSKIGLSVAFDTEKITEADSIKIVKILKESISEFDFKPVINWDKGKGVYVFNVFIK